MRRITNCPLNSLAIEIPTSFSVIGLDFGIETSCISILILLILFEGTFASFPLDVDTYSITKNNCRLNQSFATYVLKALIETRVVELTGPRIWEYFCLKYVVFISLTHLCLLTT